MLVRSTDATPKKTLAGSTRVPAGRQPPKAPRGYQPQAAALLGLGALLFASTVVGSQCPPGQ